MDNVLGVELEVEPRAAIGDHPAGEQQLARGMGLALVVVEEHARAAVHLADDDPLGAVDDEGAVRGHQRHVAHVDILLLDVLDRSGAGILVDIEHDQAQGDLQRRCIGHVALLAFLDVVFRGLQIVAHELQHRGLVEVPDREHRLEHALQALAVLRSVAIAAPQEEIVGAFLNLDEIGHLRDFANLAIMFPNTFATGKDLAHVRPRVVICPPRAAGGAAAVGPSTLSRVLSCVLAAPASCVPDP